MTASCIYKIKCRVINICIYYKNDVYIILVIFFVYYANTRTIERIHQDASRRGVRRLHGKGGGVD